MILNLRQRELTSFHFFFFLKSGYVAQVLNSQYFCLSLPSAELTA